MEKNQAETPITPRGMSEVDAARYIGVARISLRQGRCEGRRENRMPPPPFLEIFNLYVDAIGDKGLKLTKAGNLPQKFCHDAASYLGSGQAFPGRHLY